MNRKLELAENIKDAERLAKEANNALASLKVYQKLLNDLEKVSDNFFTRSYLSCGSSYPNTGLIESAAYITSRNDNFNKEELEIIMKAIADHPEVQIKLPLNHKEVSITAKSIIL